MQILHHGFACNTEDGFVLAFAHGNLGDTTSFKTVNRDDMVAPAALEPVELGDDGPARAWRVPRLDNMMAAESPEEFTNLEAADNTILTHIPNHCLITASTFEEVGGAKVVSAKDLAFKIIEAFQAAAADDDEISIEREAEAEGLEDTLAFLWASEQGILAEVRLEDVPENTMMNHLIRGVRGRIITGTTNPSEGETQDPTTPGEGSASMQMMAASSQSMVALLSRFHEGTEEDRRKKESEKSILKTMGPTQRGLFTSLCTRRMNVEPAMTEFMRNLTTSTTPQKALNLIQSEMRDWEGTFSVGGFHRMLSNGFLSQDPNRANPGGFTIFMFHPKTVDLGTKGGKGGNELLREYLGMEVDEATLEFYMRQGFYTPNTPHDLRVQLQTAHDTLELLTCDGTIAGKGLAYVLDASRWARMTTILNDRFKSEKDFGAKFCYSLDRNLQTFFNKVTRWDDIAADGQSRYLVNKAEELIERLEDGQGLNVVLPAALSHPTPSADKTKRVAVGIGTPEKVTKKKKTATATANHTESSNSSVNHPNKEPVTDWTLPSGVDFLDLFGTKMPGLKGWPVLLDTRIPKRLNKAQRAPMCVRFQSTGVCQQGCSLAHITSSAMSETARATATARFKAVYGA
ncbi:hypothetical protein MHU86_18254 [Fragilaria crotonensis]|nr:hypothetical protein MHU86_18254 [Fragilaria crotonensis]